MHYTEYQSLLNQLNQETYQHSTRVAEICHYLASKLTLDEEIAFKIGLLHDVGKIYIPSRIVRKSTKLTEIEREIVDLHAYFGYKMLKSLGEPPIIYMPVLFHHGYWKPKLCVNEEEAIEEQLVKYVCILHSADVYDAMTSPRVYHKPFTKEETLATLSTDILSNAWIIEQLEALEGKNSAHSFPQTG